MDVETGFTSKSCQLEWRLEWRLELFEAGGKSKSLLGIQDR